MKSRARLATSPRFDSRAAAAEHIALEASRLARIANANDFDLLAYLIDMVVLEAWREASERGRGTRPNRTTPTAGERTERGASPQRHALAGMALDAAGDIELQQTPAPCAPAIR